MSIFIDLTGQKFGRLTVIKRASNGNSNVTRWLTICDCGNKRTIHSGNLRRGISTSCGCFRKENPIGIYWTKSLLKKEAKKYKTKKEFSKNNRSAYSTAHRIGVFEEICRHMKKLGNSHKRALYAFEYPDKSVYVGLTFNYDDRYSYHMRNNQVLIEKAKLGGQIFKKFNVCYNKNIVGQKEAELIEKYRSKGWKILNKVKAGGLGGNKVFWTKENCIKEAKNYETRKEWSIKSKGSYYAAYKNKWFKHCTEHMKPINHSRPITFIKVKCIENGKIYSSISECIKDIHISRTSIKKILRKNTKTVKGFTVQYAK